MNVNGIRAARRRGFGDWLDSRGCDVVALQEVRCPVIALPPGAFGDYHASYDAGTLPGRNGVAVLTRSEPVAVRTWNVSDVPLARGLREFAHEGRYIEVDLAEAPLTVASLYIPKGGLPAEWQRPGNTREVPDGGAKHLRKMRFLDAFARQLSRNRIAARNRGREYLLMGDANIAHQRHDVRNWRSSNRVEGFLPVEREWFGSILSPRTLVDVVRARNGEVDGPYSWWSWRGESFAKDVGWRIDYHLATPPLARAAVADWTDKEPSADSRMSDHCPVVVDYDI